MIEVALFGAGRIGQIHARNIVRQQGVKLKFNPLTQNIKGKSVVVIDDSIVRGNTTQAIVKLMRDEGAREVHVRITSPPMIHPCFSSTISTA